MTNTYSKSIAAALVLALAACGARDEVDPFIAGVPDAEGLALEVQGGAAEGLAAEGGVAAFAAAVPAPEDDLAAARERVRALNEAVRAVFAHVGALAATQPAGGGEVRRYGPVERCVEPGASGACAEGGSALLRLTVTRLGPVRFAFVLQARAVGSAEAEDAYLPVLAGWMIRGPVERRGAGQLGVNLDNLHAKAPGFLGRGRLAAGFANGPAVRSVRYLAAGFTPDVALHPELANGALVGHRTAAGATRVRLAALADTVEDTTAPEQNFLRVGYVPRVAGRAFAAVRGGDVAAGTYWFGRACYAPGPTGALALAYKEWASCASGVGPAACVAAAVAAGTTVQVFPDPAVEPTTWQAECALAVPVAPELELPVDVPADLDDPTPEPAADGAGAGTPPAPPADVDAVP
jgi:hypothetical protein